MEIYDTIDFEHDNAADSIEKAKTSVNENLQKTQQRTTTSGVSKCGCLTVKQQSCLLFLCVMTGVLVSIASLCVTILEKVETVHGSWSGWEQWEGCSTTCDLGMQRRQRNCSNPAPSGNGRQCLGIDNEHRLCFSEPCTEQSSPEMEATSPLPCCQEEDTYEYELYNYFEYYWYDDSIFNTPSRDDCRPCGNGVDAEEDYDDNGKMTNAASGLECCYCWAIVLSILVLLNN